MFATIKRGIVIATVISNHEIKVNKNSKMLQASLFALFFLVQFE